MKTLYLDCFSGIAGDMFLGALLDGGLKLGQVKRELRKLGLKEYTLSTKRTMKKGLAATKFHIKTKNPQSRAYRDIVRLIKQSKLHPNIKKTSLAIFETLGRAEAKVHRTSLSKIHFHEVGAVDAIVDIVGTGIALHLLKIEKVHCSAIALGSGTVDFSHGTYPVPTPATAEILKGKPTYQGTLKKELTTPTGAAIAATITNTWGPLPRMHVRAIGYGSGTRDLAQPNVLRILVGETIPEKPEVTVIETNIDDMNPEIYDYVMTRLFRFGAFDVYLENILMKKNRPGIKLTVIAPPAKADTLAGIVLSETTTLGVRMHAASRKTLERETKTVKTKYGKIKFKVAGGKRSPEYDDAKKAAKKNKIPLKDIYELK